MRYIIVFRVAVNHFGPDGIEHISIALRELTGLQRLDLGGTWFHEFGWGGLVAVFVAGGDGGRRVAACCETTIEDFGIMVT